MADSLVPEAKRQRTSAALESIVSSNRCGWFRSRPIPIAVETSDRGQHEMFYVHEGALHLMPYFKVYAERWASTEQLKVQLPDSVSIQDFEDFVGCVYTGRHPSARSGDLKRAMAMYLLADMMLAEQMLPDALERVCRGIRSPDDLAWLREVASKSGIDQLISCVAELESETQDPLLAQLVKSVVGSGKPPIGAENCLEVKLGILHDKISDHVQLGLGSLDAHIVLEALRETVWSEYSRSGTMRYYQVAAHAPAVWSMVEGQINDQRLFTVATSIAAELDRPSEAGAMTYRDEANCFCLFDSNRTLAVEVLLGVIRVGARLAADGIIPRAEVLAALPKQFDPVHCNAFVEQAFDIVLEDVDEFLPYLNKLSHDFMEKMLRNAPRKAARKIARHVFRNEATLWPSKDMFQAIRELRLL